MCTYLGIPLFHKRVTSKTFSFVVEKVRRKLSVCRTRLLTEAARAVLIRTTTSAIPFYTMQTTKLPGMVLEELECINRHFFWNEADGQRRLHSGIRRLTETNQYFSTMFLWRFYKNKNDRWAKVLRTKYGRVSDYWVQQGRSQLSYIWRCLVSNSKHLEQKFVWKVLNGKGINFCLISGFYRNQ